MSSSDKGKEVMGTPVIHRKHHTDLVDTLMPLLSQSVPPGFAPRSVVAPEVFEEMQLYMNCTDPEERRIREFRMKEVLRVLSSNPGAQSSYLRMEEQPRISAVQNSMLGRVFDFRTAEIESEKLLTEERGVNNTHDGGESTEATKINQHVGDARKENPQEHRTSMVSSQNRLIGHHRETVEESGDYQPPKTGALFSMGHDHRSVSGASGRSHSSTRKGSSWKRFKQTSNGTRGSHKAYHNSQEQNEADSSVKRKSREEMEGTLKFSKHTEGLMVHQKPSSSQ
ncbi:unnamed protein product [Brassica napus]|uniref:(rape) hypothetical protein n=2 Tax=Brassica napus TaxID=3708 RepID=A0A816YNU4_BRANA|nr:unnamed protein product [Brassica napus]